MNPETTAEDWIKKMTPKALSRYECVQCSRKVNPQPLQECPECRRQD